MVMSTKLTAEPSELEWDTDIDYKKYGLEVYRLKKDGELTDFKAIYSTRSNKLLTVQKLGYRLLPNEVVLDVANRMAENVYLEPFKLIADSIMDWRHFVGKSKYYESKKEGHVVVQSIPGETHAILDSEATRIFAFYTLPDLKVMDKNEEINFGICVRNAIDGTGGLAIQGFTFRHICSNASLMTLQQVMKSGYVWGITKKHTKKLDISLANLENWMLQVADSMKSVEALYGRWMVEKANRDVVSKLGRMIPAKYLPDYISVEKKNATISSSSIPTMWELYNNVTANLWHEPIELKTKELLFQKMHVAFGLGR